MPLWGFSIQRQRLFAGLIFSTRPSHLFSAGRGFPFNTVKSTYHKPKALKGHNTSA
jgi:hypothetical protein